MRHRRQHIGYGIVKHGALITVYRFHRDQDSCRSGVHGQVAEMRENPVKARLTAGAASFGTIVWEFATAGMAAVLEVAGAEFCVFDMEHSGLTLETMRWLIRACRGTGVVPLVRVPAHEYRYVAGALDAGAQGLMIPMTESAALRCANWSEVRVNSPNSYSLRNGAIS